MSEDKTYIELRLVTPLEPPGPSSPGNETHFRNSYCNTNTSNSRDPSINNGNENFNNHNSNNHYQRSGIPDDDRGHQLYSPTAHAPCPFLTEVPALDFRKKPSPRMREGSFSESESGDSSRSGVPMNWDRACVHPEVTGSVAAGGEEAWTAGAAKHVTRWLEMALQAVVKRLLVLQVALFLVSVILSNMVFLPLALVTQGFRGQCLLFSDIVLVWNSNDTVSVDLINTFYGSARDCELPTFIAVSVCVACIIFSWFYLCNIFFAAGETKESTSRIQVPALLIFVSLFIGTIVAASKISGGFRIWCDNIRENKPYGTSRKLHCREFEELEWTNSINSYKFYTRYVIAEVACWMLCVSLFVLCCVTCAGCYQLLRPADNLNTSQATLSVSLGESLEESGVLDKVKSPGRGRRSENRDSGRWKTEEGMGPIPEVDSSGQDYYSPQEYQDPLSGKAGYHPSGGGGGGGTSVRTEAAVHSNADDPASPLTSSSEAEGFVESEKVASGVINLAEGDEIYPYSSSSPASDANPGKSYQREAGPRSELSSSREREQREDEKKTLAKNSSVGGGYGATSMNR